MSPLIKNTLFALGFALIAWLGYVVFIQEDEPVLVTDDRIIASQAARDTQDFLLRLQQLRTIDIDQSFFTSPEFRSLTDYRQDIITEPVGRDNPFAPTFR